VPDKHPYMSGSTGLVQAMDHLRKSFPMQVTVGILRKLGIASKNEISVINILRFIGVIDNEGRKTPEASSVFTKHEDEEFRTGLAKMVAAGYSDHLFSLHGEDAWDLPQDKLISCFRTADQTSAIVGQRQAAIFQTLAALSGHGERPVQKAATLTQRPERKSAPKRSAKGNEHQAAIALDARDPVQKSARDVGLTVRIEVNLPTTADQETYDRIFKSIRENLMDG
jgi:hypothetical protein